MCPFKQNPKYLPKYLGKTAMLTCYGTGQYRNEYVATVAQSFNIRVDIFDERVEVRRSS